MNELTPVESAKLIECEAIIRRGLNVFVEVGQSLLTIRDSRLYRAEFGAFEDYCQERWGFTRMRASQLIAAAEVVGNVNNCLQIPATESQARPLAQLEPAQQREAWQHAVETAPNGKITAAHVQRVVDNLLCDDEEEEDTDNGCHNCAHCMSISRADFYLVCTFLQVPIQGEFIPCGMKNWKDEEEPTPETKPHVAYNSGNNEWYTPKEYIDAARKVMAGLDLDPASSESANAIVGATRFFTTKDDGLSQEWSGKVWMNPPYASGLIGKFADKMAISFKSGKVTEAIVLVNNATETAWFRVLIDVASAICFTSGRVKFWSPDRDSATPLQGQALIYLGKKADEFRREFGEFGWTATL